MWNVVSAQNCLRKYVRVININSSKKSLFYFFILFYWDLLQNLKLIFFCFCALYVLSCFSEMHVQYVQYRYPLLHTLYCILQLGFYKWKLQIFLQNLIPNKTKWHLGSIYRSSPALFRENVSKCLVLFSLWNKYITFQRQHWCGHGRRACLHVRTRGTLHVDARSTWSKRGQNVAHPAHASLPAPGRM